MNKSKTSTYVVEIGLKTDEFQNEILESRFNIVHHITNVLVKHSIKCIHQLERDSKYRTILTKKGKLSRQDKIDLTNIRMKYGLSEYQFHSYVTVQQSMYKKHINSMIAQKIATKVWKSVEKYLFSNGNSIHFKKFDQIISYEGKTNTTGIVYKNGYILNNGLKLKLSYRKSDELITKALSQIEEGTTRVKYCRIVRKFIKNKYQYFVQLILEGNPIKEKNIPILVDKTVGIDIGPSSIAVVSDEKIIFKELASNIKKTDNEIARLNRKLDRQRRSNNLQNYNEDGTIKRNSKYFKRTWHYSKNMIKTKNQLRYLYQKRSNQLKLSHTLLANEILKLGSNIIIEDMQWSALARKAKKTEKSEKTGKFKKKKRFGKSIANHAPSKLIEIMNTKLKYIGKEITKVDCFKTAATKFNHNTGELMDISLKDRYVVIDGHTIQRDIHSAFNLQNVIITKTDIAYSYDLQTMNDKFTSFIEKHDELINNLKKQKQLGTKFPNCMSI